MAVPNDRRVIYGAYAIPQVSYSTTSTEVTREEGSTAGRASYTDYKLDTTVAKRFGGKGSVAITEDQTIDGWVSFMSPADDTWDSRSATGDDADVWEDTHTVWDRGGRNVTDTLAVILTGSTAIKFLYIKNLGSEECELSLEASGGSDERDILIPPGASVAMRTTSSVTAATVKVATAASSGNTTEIEYVIAI